MEVIAVALAAVLVTVLTMLGGFVVYRAFQRRLHLDSDLQATMSLLGEHLSAHTKAVNALTEKYTASGEHIGSLPKLVEGWIRISQEQVEQTAQLKSCVEKLTTVFLAGGGTDQRQQGSSFEPYSEEAATRAYTKNDLNSIAGQQPEQRAW